MRLRVLAFLVISLVPAVSASQDLESLHPGDNIRIGTRPPNQSRLEGALLSVSVDSLRFRHSNWPRPAVDTLSFAMPNIQSLDVRRRTGGAFTRSAVVGLVIGVGLGALASLGHHDPKTEELGGPVLAGILGGAAGLLGGMVYGACCASDWVPIQLPPTRTTQ